MKKFRRLSMLCVVLVGVSMLACSVGSSGGGRGGGGKGKAGKGKGKKGGKGKKSAKGGKGAKGAKGKGKGSSGGPAGITKHSETSYTVTSSLQKKWQNKPGTFVGGGNQTNAGVKLQGVNDKKDGFWVGLRSGDTVYNVNGYSLKSQMESALAGSQLKNKKQYTIKLKRKGSNKTIKIKVK